jgi:hypothetical protein
VAAVFLLLLWVRITEKTDSIFIPMSGSWSVAIGVAPGSCGTGITTRPPQGFHWDSINVDRIAPVVPQQYAKYFASHWGRFGYFNDAGAVILVPFWFLIGLALALSGAPWLKWSSRFSIRTLLIAMTLVAIVLGLIVWSINR